MSLATKSTLIFLIAVSLAFLYRRYETEDAIKAIEQIIKSAQSTIYKTYATIPTTNDETIDQALSEQLPERLTSCPEDNTQVRLWTKDELANYDGHSGPTDVYLGFLGVVYNVTLNSQHYGPGADYNAFAGHDATRAFVTGNFTHDLVDDIRDIDEKMYLHFETWASFYSTTYESLGRIEGAFFDSRGCATPELTRVYGIFSKLASEKINQDQQDKRLPECNSEWNGDLKKGRVWCSTKSGGVDREWVGVPRILDDGESKRCVCLNQDDSKAVENAKNLERYPACDPDASECSLEE